MQAHNHTNPPSSSNTLHTFPPPIINFALQPPRNQTLNTTFKPNFPEQRIIPSLIQEQLVMAAQRGVDFTMFVEIRSDGPGAVVEIEEEDHAFADVDEEADLSAASVKI
jgi:hypothetical protein